MTKTKQDRPSKKSAPKKSESSLMVIDHSQTVYLEMEGRAQPIFSMTRTNSKSGIIKSDSCSYRYENPSYTDLRVVDDKSGAEILRTSCDHRDCSGFTVLPDGRVIDFGPEGIGPAPGAGAELRLITRDQSCKVIEISKKALSEELLVLAIVCWGYFHCCGR